MKFALLVLSTVFSFSAFAGSFDVNDARILGQYKLAKASKEAEISEVKIIRNNADELVLVRDEDIEYPLEQADRTGLIHQSGGECNAGSGDEPDCYYDANVEIRLNAARNERGQVVPQITIDVDRVDGYDANPDYSYKVVFIWAAEIEDAVPFYYNAENPADLAAILENCKNEYGAVMGHPHYHNRACHTADSFVIRNGIDPKKAFDKLVNRWSRNAQPINKNQLQNIFASSNEYFKEHVRLSKKGDVASLVKMAQPARQYILANSDILTYVAPVGGIGWLYVLDIKNGIMHQYAIFVD